MTEEEKQELREAKKGVTERLRNIPIASYGLALTDTRLDAYCREVAEHPEHHNLWEQLAVADFFRKIDRYGFDDVAVRKFFTFYELMWFPGKQGLTRYALTPVQTFQFANVYAFWKGGKRVVRDCVLYVPRKFSKTTGTAAFALYDLFFGDANGEIYIGANSQDQAKKCFDVIRSALRKLDTTGKRFVINEQVVKPSRRNKRGAFAQCLTANARTKDGLNASTVIMDEFSQARDSDLLTVLTTSMGVRVNPLTVIITTASDVFDGPFYDMLKGYKEVLLGRHEDDSLFAHLFEPDVGDAEDDPATWRKVHPHLGITVQEDFYEQEWKKAQRNGAEAMLAFRTKLLNVYSENSQKSWISGELIRSIQKPVSLGAIGKRMPAVIGIDLSVRGDFSCVTTGLYDRDGGRFTYHTKYFFPSGGMAGHHNEQLYRRWAIEGHLVIQESEVINYSGIVNYILEVSQWHDIFAICYDPAKSLDCINQLATTDVGWCLKPFGQTNYHFTSAVQSFEIGVRTGRIDIDANPINAYCFANATLVTDNMGNMKPYKRTAEGKIDSVITTLMAQKGFEEAVRSIDF